MKKLSFLMLLLLATSVVHAQRPSKVAPPSVAQAKATYDQMFKQLLKDVDGNMMTAKQVTPYHAATPTASNKTNVSPISVGRASNAFSILRAEQNQVYADASLDLVAFIHRHDVTIFGGGAAANGKFRYDVSIDNGGTWSIDNGVLNNTYSRPGRYPNMTGRNGSGNTDPFQSEFIYNCPTLDPSPDWDGNVYGVSDVTTGGTTTSTEHYDFLAMNTLLNGGLCKGATDVFWTVDFWYDGTNAGDSVYIQKGVYASNDVSFTRVAVAPDHYTGFDGTVTAIGPNVAASPDGMDVWVAWLGDLNGGVDSTLMPIFMHSSDGGTTWGSPMEMNLNDVPWIADSLQTLWTDSLGNILSTGRATTAFDFDLTVDVNGDPHLVAVIGSATTIDAPEPGYSIYSGLAKFLADITTSDGGATIDVTYIAPVLAFRGEFGTPDPNDGSLLAIDNFTQISRDASGQHIFYSWVDSDTNTVGFGESNNLAPNLRISSMRVSDGFQTCYKLITDGDLVWDGKALFPTMAPEVLEDINGYDYSLPIVMLEMITNDQLAPCQFHYIGNNSYFMDSDYMDPSSINLSWDGGCAVPANPDDIFSNAVEGPNSSAAAMLTAYPNPASNNVTVMFEMTKASDVEVTLVNMYGQTVATVAEGLMNTGNHKFAVSTSELAGGIYFVNLRTGNSSMTEKLVIVK
jgi:hypothetical protein